MCGRLNIIADPLAQMVSETLGLEFWTTTNNDLRPSQAVSVLEVDASGTIATVERNWGIAVPWTSNLVINAKSETVTHKHQFKLGFERNPVVVPCNGWYEWSGNKGQKRKWLFESTDKVIYMAGIAVNGGLVTLTRAPTPQCAQYHHRMPLVLAPEQVRQWLGEEPNGRQRLLVAKPTSPFVITEQRPTQDTPQLSLF